MLLINLFSLTINLVKQILILVLFCHGRIREAHAKDESMHTSKREIAPSKKFTYHHTWMSFTSANSCSTKSSQKDQEHSPSIFPKINFITKVIWRKFINSNEIMVLNVFKLLEIETPFIKREPSTNKQADCTTEWLPSIILFSIM